jgi:hypothetical protein
MFHDVEEFEEDDDFEDEDDNSLDRWNDRQLLEIILIKLNQLIDMTQADFDTILANLGTAIKQVKTDTEALVAKAKAAGVDLSTEGATVTASLADLAAIHAEAVA